MGRASLGRRVTPAVRPERLRVGVPSSVLEIPPTGGHGRVWHRVLTALSAATTIVALDERRRPLRRHRVVLANGHDYPPVTRRPLVVEVHEAGWFEPGLRELLAPEFYELIARRTERAIEAAAHVITLSEAARGDLIKAYRLDPSRVHAVHPGVDGTFVPGARGGRELVAAKRGGRLAPYVLYASTLHPRKNLTVLREAMAALAREGLPHVLAIAGGPAPDRPDSSDLEQAAAAELHGAPGRVVRFAQPSDHELAALMAGAAAFCLPSLYEGFGLTALEAMACGAPVVVSDRGALPEVVGDTGLVVEPTEAAVAEGLRTLLLDQDEAQRLGDAAAARARKFTWERTAAGWLSVLRSAVEQP